MRTHAHAHAHAHIPTQMAPFQQLASSTCTQAQAHAATRNTCMHIAHTSGISLPRGSRVIGLQKRGAVKDTNGTSTGPATRAASGKAAGGAQGPSGAEDAADAADSGEQASKWRTEGWGAGPKPAFGSTAWAEVVLLRLVGCVCLCVFVCRIICKDEACCCSSWAVADAPAAQRKGWQLPLSACILWKTCSLRCHAVLVLEAQRMLLLGWLASVCVWACVCERMHVRLRNLLRHDFQRWSRLPVLLLVWFIAWPACATLVDFAAHCARAGGGWRAGRGTRAAGGGRGQRRRNGPAGRAQADPHAHAGAAAQAPGAHQVRVVPRACELVVCDACVYLVQSMCVSCAVRVCISHAASSSCVTLSAATCAPGARSFCTWHIHVLRLVCVGVPTCYLCSAWCCNLVHARRGVCEVRPGCAHVHLLLCALLKQRCSGLRAPLKSTYETGRQTGDLPRVSVPVHARCVPWPTACSWVNSLCLSTRAICAMNSVLGH